MDLINAKSSPYALTRPPGEITLPLRPALPLGERAPDAAKIAKTAREFESVFAKMLISSMRQASFGDSLFPDENSTYRDMYDQQLAKSLSAGPGLGLAPIIARQLSGPSQPVDATSADSGEPAAMRSLGTTPWMEEVEPRLEQRPRSPSVAEATTAWMQEVEQRREQLPMAGREQPLGSYHHPASATAPAWLSHNRQQPMANGHLDLSRGTGPDAATGPLSPSPARFALTPPIPTGPAASAPSAIKSDSPENFVASIWPQAQRAAQELGVDPKILVAQAALETGWGRHVVGRQEDGSGGNLFGIKAGRQWSGQAVSAGTREFIGGANVQQTASFRAYGSVEASFNDYVALLKNNGRYAECLGCGDRQRFASALSRAGYATDPHYASKLVAIADGPTLRRSLARLNPEPSLAANTSTASNAAIPAAASET